MTILKGKGGTVGKKLYVKKTKTGNLISAKPFKMKPRNIYARPVPGGIVFANSPHPSKHWSKPIYISPTHSYGGIPGSLILQQADRKEHAQEIDLSLHAGHKDTFGHPEPWQKTPNRRDIPDFDVVGEKDEGQKWLAKVEGGAVAEVEVSTATKQETQSVDKQIATEVKAAKAKDKIEAKKAEQATKKAIDALDMPSPKQDQADKWEGVPTAKQIETRGIPYYTNDFEWMAKKFGKASMGWHAKTGNQLASNQPGSIIAGTKQGLAIDAFTLIEGQKAIDDLLKKPMRQLQAKNPSDYEHWMAYNAGDLKKKLYPSDMGALHPVWLGAVHAPMGEKHLAYLTDGKSVTVANADALALAHKYAPNAQLMSQGPTSPIVFANKEGGELKLKAMVMPMYVQVPEKVKETINGTEKPTEPASSPPIEAPATETPTASAVPPPPIAKAVEEVADKELKPPKLSDPKPAALNQHDHAMKNGTKDWKADLEQISGKKGSNDGGLFKDKKTNVMYYVKFTDEPHATSEALASRLYQLAGTPVPQVDAIKWGDKWAVKSEWIDKLEPMSADQIKSSAGVKNHFIADAWLANWDVIGAANDNVAKAPDGTVYRLDLGGSLIWRAQGKTKDFLEPVNELDTMTNTAYPAGKVFSVLNMADKKAQAKAVAGITDGQIDEAVDEAMADKTYHGEAGLHGINLNLTYKTILKKRRDYIIEHVLKYEPPKPLTTEELSKLSKLKPENTDLILAKKDLWSVNADAGAKKQVQTQIMKSQLGPGNGAEAVESVAKTYGDWKGSSNSSGGMLLRWAAAKNVQLDQSVYDALYNYWKHKGINAETELSALKASVEKHGPATTNGVAINREMHNVYLRDLHHTTNPKATVPLYRAWHGDQAHYYGWDKLTSGDKIEVQSPVMFSFSLSKSKANGFYSNGGKLTKVDVPINDVMLSDRMTNMNGGCVSEDEVLFIVPKGYTLEVLK